MLLIIYKIYIKYIMLNWITVSSSLLLLFTKILKLINNRDNDNEKCELKCKKSSKWQSSKGYMTFAFNNTTFGRTTLIHYLLYLGLTVLIQFKIQYKFKEYCQYSIFIWIIIKEYYNTDIDNKNMDDYMI